MLEKSGESFKEILRMKDQDKWWKVLPISLFSFGILAGLLGFLPFFSVEYLTLGMILAVITTISAILQRTERYKRSKYITIHAGILILFLIGARQWFFYMKNAWIWITPLIIAYGLAWIIPYLNPKLSLWLWREQFTPKTSIGKAISKISWVVLPIAGAGGAFLGMFLSRTGEIRTASMLLGPIFMVSSIGFAQVASHQLKEEFKDTQPVFE